MLHRIQRIARRPFRHYVVGSAEMLRPGDKIEVHVRIQLEIAFPLHIAVQQRRRPRPVLGRGLDEEHFRHPALFTQSGDRVSRLSRHRIGLGARGEGEKVRRREIALAVVPIDRGHAEALIKEPLSCSRDMDESSVENAAPVGVEVKSVVKKMVDEASRLRDAEDHGALECTEERIFGPVPCRLVETQERDRVAQSREPEPRHPRVARGVDEIVDPPGTKALLHVEAGGIGFHFPIDPAGKGPIGVRDRLGRRLTVFSPCQDRAVVVFRDGGIGGRDAPRAVEKVTTVDGFVDRDLDMIPPRHGRSVGIDRNGNSGEETSGPVILDLSAPSGPEHRVSLAHEKSISRVFGCDRGVGADAFVESPKRQFVPPVVNVVEERAVSLRRIDRLQQSEVRPELDAAAFVHRRQREIDDAGVCGIFRIEFEMETPVNDFVDPAATVGGTFGKRGAVTHFDLYEVGIDGPRE